jgi:signal transduction histidine kinase/HAMP domain-containing protein
VNQHPSPNKPSKTTSLSRRFSFALIVVIATLLIGFSIVAILFNSKRIENEMETRLNNAVEFAQNSLATPLWNLDYAVVKGFVDALFLDESIAFIRISWRNQVAVEEKRPGFELGNLESPGSSEFFRHEDFIVKTSDIHFKGNLVGNIMVVMSREHLKKQARLQVAGILALSVLIVGAIWITTIIITKRYISSPLLRLQRSASSIAHGDLDTLVEKDTEDEIGILATHLDLMRESIKDLFHELHESKVKIEEYSRTLENKVDIRTRELARSVEELQALGEVSQAVSSSLDLERVLKSIVRHAVQLSKADAGTIYEFNESEQVFLPRINHGLSEKFVDELRKSKMRLGDKTLIGRAALKKAPEQISDLVDRPDYPLPHVLEFGFRALLAIPLFREDRLIGGLIVRRKQPGEFALSVVTLLQTFAAQSVLAIHNARLFKEIEEKGREIEIANKHKSEFLANMSHELRTPLNAILGYTELILDNIYGEAPAKIREILERVGKNGRHLLGLVNNVLDLSKIEAGRFTLSLGDYSMSELVQTVITSVEALASEKKLELKVSVPTDLPTGKGDGQRIAQVLLNVIGNAIKFCEKGEVSVQVTESGESFLVSVSDTGPGISKNDQERIFEEFQQVDGSSTREKDGTGLGLSIAKKIIEMHEGRIWVESTVGKGSIFRFTLPVRVEKQWVQK